MTVHSLKCDAWALNQTRSGAKFFEMRLADRVYAVDDYLDLEELIRVRVRSAIRITGTIVPPQPHWWEPVEAMQHGVVVMSIDLTYSPDHDECCCPWGGLEPGCICHGNGVQRGLF